MRILDPHVHLFDLQRGQYQWLKPDNPPFWPDKALIHQSFNQSHLALGETVELVGFVHIEAGFDNQQPWREVAWLEDTVTLAFKSVAAVDLTWSAQDFEACLDHLTQFTSVVGVRHILDEQASTLLASPLVVANLARLAQRDLLFELQMPVSDTQAVEALCRLSGQLAGLRMVLNHAGFPPLSTVGQDARHQWKINLKRLSELDSLRLKVSGLEMTHRGYTSEQFERALNDCIECFGIQRVMLASNFPLCLFHSTYENYWRQAMSVHDANALLLDNAARCYGF